MAQVAKLLDDKIIAIDYVENYGSICSEQRIKDRNGLTMILPLSQDYNIEECLNKELYKDFFPNDKYMSSLFILKEGNLRVENTDLAARLNNQGVKIRPKKYTQKYKLICWFHAAKLGYDKSDVIADLIAGDLEARVFAGKIANADQKSNIKCEVTSHSTTIPKIFKNLENFIDVNWSMYPYTWLTINFTMTYLSNCHEPFTALPAIDCFEFSGSINTIKENVL